MTLDDVIRLEPSVRVCDILRLFLFGEDESFRCMLIGRRKHYFDIFEILDKEKINSPARQSYYECVVEDMYMMDEGDGWYLTLVIRMGENDNR